MPAPRQPSPRTAQSLADRLLTDPGEVRPVDEGGEHATWWVGAGHVLRLAPDAAASARQRREIALRDALRPRLPVPVPQSGASGEWADGLAYTLDIRLPGVSAEHRQVSPAGERDLTRLLGALREFAPGHAEALGVPAAPPRHLAAVRAGAVRAARTLEADGAFDGRLLGLLETDPRAHASDPPPYASDPHPYASEVTGTEDPAHTPPAVLAHHDLKGEHLLTDEEGRVSGVLDWTDAVLGDPAEDIAGLALALGAPAAARVADAAGHTPQRCARGLQLARCDTLIRLADRLHGIDDSPLPLLRAQVRRAWEGTPLDRAVS